MSKRESAPTAAADADVVMVEAATADDALSDVTRRFGADATILGASKVLRGGLGGFFAKEHIQLRVLPRPTRATPDAPTPSTGEAPSPAVSHLLRKLTDSVDTRERRFADALRSQVANREVAMPSAAPAAPAAPATPLAPGAAPSPPPPPASPAPGAAPAPPAPGAAPWDAPAPRASDESAWPPRILSAAGVARDVRPAPWLREAASCPWGSVDALDELGVPTLVRDAVQAAHPSDELAWLGAVAAAVGPLCRPLPVGPVLLAGPRSAVLAAGLGIPTVLASGPAPEDGSAAVAVGGRAAPGWIAWNRMRRWVHVVVGGRGWQTVIDQDPLAVSWVRAEDLPVALDLAASDGLVLGFDGSRIPTRRVEPLDVAIALRNLLR